ncbi:hypothetical protein [Dactylosporangium sp. NPDC050588]|uniref:hypothetical protein n=1 Tax=Dactylosporangium sp. NPDC050588 TaxID=3157211 RepID=UPI0033E5B96D
MIIEGVAWLWGPAVSKLALKPWSAAVLVAERGDQFGDPGCLTGTGGQSAHAAQPSGQLAGALLIHTFLMSNTASAMWLNALACPLPPGRLMLCPHLRQCLPANGEPSHAAKLITP